MNILSRKHNIYLVGTPRTHAKALSRHVSEALKVGSTLLKYTKPIDVAIIDAESWDIPEKM
jgi:hypothetical protein